MWKNSFYFIFFACIFFIANSSHAGSTPDVIIERIVITPPASNTHVYTVKVEIKNNGSVPIPINKLSVQKAIEKSDGQWRGIGGMGLIEPLGAQETKPVFSTFERKSSERRLKGTLWYNGDSSVVAHEKIVSLPLEATPQFDVRCEFVDSRTYKITIKNVASTGVSGILVKGAVAKDSRFGRWEYGDPLAIKFFHKDAAHEYSGRYGKEDAAVKVTVLHEGAKVTEKMFEIKPAATNLKGLKKVK
jgi:hypothetical protein